MTDETPQEELPDLRTELARRARKAGVKVTKDMSVSDLENAIAKAALDAAAEAPEDPVPEPATVAAGHVQVRITKHGAGKVHDGKGGFYPMDAMVSLPPDVAQALEDRAYGEIR